jgi:hypothetical protein
MISLSPIKVLTLSQAPHEGRHAHLSAASGLVQIGDQLYVVADDENHLGVFSRGDKNGYLKVLFGSELPLEHEARKAAKPDLEVLTLIPSSKKYPHSALLALGSGSKSSRKLGVIIPLNHLGSPEESVEIINLGLLYDELNKEFGKLNIEGAVVINDDIILFQRGNKKNKINASIRFSLNTFYKFTSANDNDKKHKLVLDITHYELGEINGVPLCFTDATPLSNGTIIFTAAAENTSDAYLDGACMGSAIGIITPYGELHNLSIINETIKLEGIAANVVDSKVHLLLVSDADNEAIPAQLYSAILEGYPFT